MARSGSADSEFIKSNRWKKEHWNWSDGNFGNLSKNIREIGRSIMNDCTGVDKTAVAFISFSTIKIPGKSEQQKHGRLRIEYKLKHVHVIGRLKKGKAMLLNDIAATSSSPGHIESASDVTGFIQ